MTIDAATLFATAHAAGNAAVQTATVTPMIVTQCQNPLDDSSTPVRQYFVEDGVCGFASVVIKPARGKFVALLKKRGIGGAHYYGGYSVSSWEFAPSIRQDQSYERACAAARGAVEVLKSYGINAYVDSRID